MTKKELKSILNAHKKWICDEASGAQADLTGADLIGVNLRGADLTRADLAGAYLTGISLTGAYLVEADLAGTDLRRADLTGANLAGANLRKANLARANLTGANLARSDLRGANLTGADLTRSDLRRANLTGADLTEAYLTSVDLTRADLTEAIINWMSHALISEILRAVAGANVEKLKLAGLVLIGQNMVDWCWEKYLSLDDPLTDWALSVLHPYMRDEDNAPEMLRNYEPKEVSAE